MTEHDALKASSFTALLDVRERLLEQADSIEGPCPEKLLERINLIENEMVDRGQ